MGDIPNIIDVDSYCAELSNITNIDFNSIQAIVLVSFARVYDQGEKKIDFVQASEQIETQIDLLLSQSKAPVRVKTA